MKINSNTILWSVTGLLLGCISLIAVYKAWPILFPKISINIPADPDCDLRAGPCISRLAQGGTVTFSVEPRSIPVVKPLQLWVEVTGLETQAVEIDFTGVDMNMGFNRSALERQEAGRFSGKGMLPVCVRDVMEWEARVLIHTDLGLMSVPYRFITVKPGREPPGG